MRVQNPLVHLYCNLCGGTQFEEYRGRPSAICVGCRALERHRIMKAVWDKYLTKEVGLQGKDVLSFCPPPSICKYLYSNCNLRTADIDPDAATDLVVDISNMPSIENSSFDVVEVSAVLNHCRDDRAAVPELHRILRPKGIVLIWVPYRTNSEEEPNRVLSDPKVSTYGRGKYEKFGIADWRTYGDLELIDILSPYFITKTYHGRDPVTLKTNIIFVGFKRLH